MNEDAEVGQMGWAQEATAETAETLIASAADPTARLLEALVELTAVEGGLPALAPVLTELMCSVANADGAAVAQVDGAEFVFIASTGLLAGTSGNRNTRQGSLGGLVIATAKAQVCRDTHADTRVDREACDRDGVRSLAIMPIRNAEHTVAFVLLAGAEPGGITESDVDLVDPLLRIATIKLGQAVVAEAAAAQFGLVELITSASRDVLLADDPGQCLVEAIARVMHAPHVYLLLPDGHDGLTISRTVGSSLGPLRLPADESSISGLAYTSGRTQFISDWTTSGQIPAGILERLTAAKLHDARSAVFIPLETADDPAGVVVVMLREPLTASNADQLGLLRLLAAEAGIAISRENLRQRLADQARSDPLTGLGNRRVWDERLALELERAKRTDSPFAIAVLDLDLFKHFNDSFGHLAGDELLQATSEAWKRALRPTDLVARLGGEEFGVILPDTDLDTAGAIMRRLGALVTSGQTVSIGVTLHLPGEDTAATVQRADQALYAAKSAGRNQTITL
jgi:diguanylate cyclase (GGDEF)-like protein